MLYYNLEYLSFLKKRCFPLKVLQINAIIIGVLFVVFSFFYLLTTIIAGRMIDKAVSEISRTHNSSMKPLTQPGLGSF